MVSREYLIVCKVDLRNGLYSDVFFYTDFDDTLQRDLDCTDGCIYMRWYYSTLTATFTILHLHEIATLWKLKAYQL